MKTENEEKATPRPWKTYGENGIEGPDGEVVCNMVGFAFGIEEQEKANAALIVKAVNAYDADQEIIRELVDAAKELQKQIGNGQPFHEAENKMLRAIERAEARHA